MTILCVCIHLAKNMQALHGLNDEPSGHAT